MESDVALEILDKIYDGSEYIAPEQDPVSIIQSDHSVKEQKNNPCIESDVSDSEGLDSVLIQF